MSPRHTLILLIALCWMSAAAQDLRQNQAPESPVFKLSSRSNLVLVPVVVRKKGDHIVGLSAKDFTLQEDGQDRKVVSFEEVTTSNQSFAKPEAVHGVFSNAQDVSTSSRPRLSIVLLDLMNSPFSDRQRVEHAMLQFLEKQVTDSRIQLVALTSKKLEVIHDFTDDPQVLSAALKAALDGKSAAVLPQGSVDEKYTHEVTYLSSLSSEMRSPAAAVEQRSLTQWTLEALQHIAQGSAGINGRKSLIWLTSGLPSGLPSYGVNGQLLNTTVGDVPFSFYEKTMQMLSDANVAVYPVDAHGLFDPGFRDMAGANRSANGPTQRSRWDSMVLFAEKTGGRAAIDTNFLEKAVDEAIKDNSHYYLLSYAPNPQDHRVGWRKIKVKVDVPGAEVRARDGFFYAEKASDPAKGRQEDVATALRSPMDYTALPLQFRWVNEQPGGEKRKVVFQIKIPASVLDLTDSSAPKVDLEIAIAATETEDKDCCRFWQNIKVNPQPASVAKIQSEGIVYRNVLEMRPGAHHFRAVVRDNLTGMTGSLAAVIEAR